MIGVISRITDRGFGFITPESGDKDILFRANDLSGLHFDALDIGQLVQFQWFYDAKGRPRAEEVELLESISGKTHEVAPTVEEQFKYIREFRTDGLVAPDGRPLAQQSREYERVIVDVSSANSEIIKFLKKTPELCWKLPPRKFEEVVANILEKQGYDISLTPASGDGGFDIYAARKDGLGTLLYLVECKRYVPPNKVGVEIVRSLYGVVQIQRATAGAIVTTSYFTSGAEAFRREVQYQMHLHDYIVLQKWIGDFPLTRDRAT